MSGAVLAAQPALAASGALAARTATVPAATVVRVSTLPPPSTIFGGGALPQLRPTAATGTSAPAAPAAAAVTPGVLAAKPVVALSTVLASPLRASDNGFGLDPPDQAVAASSADVVQMVNLSGRVWVGSTPGPAFSLSSFFATGGDFISDPSVFYDQASGRFFAAILDVTFGGEAIAISQTSDPNAGWFVYHVPWPGTGGTCPDQGKLGVSDNMVALGANMFTSCSSSGTYSGAIFEVFPKANMLTGSAFNFTFVNPIASLFSVVPAVSQSSTATQFFAGVDAGSGSTLHVVTATGSAAAASFSSTSLGIAPYSNPPAAPQKGSTALVDTSDTRVQRVAWLSGRLGFSFNESCVPTRDTAARACARFVALNTATNTVALSKTVGKRGKYVWNGAPAFNSLGDLVSPVSVSGSSSFPSLDALAISSSGKPSTLLVVKNGAGPETSGRYGDYNAAAIQPSAPASFWAAGQIGLGAGFGSWNTAVALINVS